MGMGNPKIRDFWYRYDRTRRTGKQLQYSHMLSAPSWATGMMCRCRKREEEGRSGSHEAERRAELTALGLKSHRTFPRLSYASPY